MRIARLAADRRGDRAARGEGPRSQIDEDRRLTQARAGDGEVADEQGPQREADAGFRRGENRLVVLAADFDVVEMQGRPREQAQADPSRSPQGETEGMGEARARPLDDDRRGDRPFVQAGRHGERDEAEDRRQNLQSAHSSVRSEAESRADAPPRAVRRPPACLLRQRSAFGSCQQDVQKNREKQRWRRGVQFLAEVIGSTK